MTKEECKLCRYLDFEFIMDEYITEVAAVCLDQENAPFVYVGLDKSRKHLLSDSISGEECPNCKKIKVS